MSKRQGLFRGLGEIEKSSNLKISIMLFLYMEFLHKKRSFDPHIGVLCKFVHDILSKVQLKRKTRKVLNLSGLVFILLGLGFHNLEPLKFYIDGKYVKRRNRNTYHALFKHIFILLKRFNLFSIDIKSKCFPITSNRI